MYINVLYYLSYVEYLGTRNSKLSKINAFYRHRACWIVSPDGSGMV